MSEANHTPGPWVHGRDDLTSFSSVSGKWVYAGEKYVAIASDNNTRSWGETMANARLIAAAPDLLAAVQAMTEAWDNGDTVHGRSEAARMARAAIAKTTGSPF